MATDGTDGPKLWSWRCAQCGAHADYQSDLWSEVAHRAEHGHRTRHWSYARRTDNSAEGAGMKETDALRVLRVLNAAVKEAGWEPQPCVYCGSMEHVACMRKRARRERV